MELARKIFISSNLRVGVLLVSKEEAAMPFTYQVYRTAVACR